MPEVTTIDYDFVYHTGRPHQNIGLIGDPELRKLVPKDRRPKGALNSIAAVIVPITPTKHERP